MSRLWIALLLILPGPALQASDWTWQGSTEAAWHSNVTNADRPADRLAALQWWSGLSGDVHRAMPGGGHATVGLQLELEIWPRYQGLNATTVGPTLALHYKFGLGAQAWLIRGTVIGGWSEVREADRSGLTGEINLEIRKRWGEAWQFVLGTQRARYDARQMAFDSSGRENFLRAEYQLNAVWRASVELRQRAGIVVSYTTPPRPDLVQAGKVLTLVDTFERNSPLLAYYFPADTRSVSLDLTRALGPATAAYLHFEYRETTHNALRYLNQRSAVGVVRRF